MLTSKTTFPRRRHPRPQVLATLLAALGAPGCGADESAELASSDGMTLGSLGQAFGEATCLTAKADAELRRDETYITPVGYTHPECVRSAVLDAPELVYEDDIVTVSWWDTTTVAEKACPSQLLRASFMAASPIFDERLFEIEYAESRGQWIKGTCVVPPLRFDYCPDDAPLQDCVRVVKPRIVVSGTINIRKDGFIPTRMVSVSYTAKSSKKE